MNLEKKNIVLIGGGGHCKSCIEVIESTENYTIMGILDLPSELGKTVLGYKVIGNDDDYKKFRDLGYCFLVTAGQIKSATLRKQIFENLESINAEVETVIASTATVSKYAKVGKGSIIMHNSIVNADAEIGENCIINTASVIEHDTKIGKHCHISTTAVVNGNCIIGNEVFIGSRSCLSNGIQIVDYSVIGAGTTVTKNILEAGTYAGSPAKKI